ncbi:MAG: glycogen debranching protein [Vicinamibacteria bacterium]
MNRWAAVEGSPFPDGVSWVEEEQAYNFALYSEHAESVTLLLYGAAYLVEPVMARGLEHLRNKSGRIWHCRIPAVEMKGARYYAYAVGGAPEAEGSVGRHRFDSEKILLDPYARSVFFPQSFDRSAAIDPGSNAGKAPLGAIHACRSSFDWSFDRPPRHDWDTVIYELHVKGFTGNPNSRVTPEHRGTYLGLVEKLPYLKELGITVVELMPVFQYDPQEGNYWGYNPLNLFSPHHEYAARGAACEQDDELRSMVKALHQEGIEVILDVVYNHTGEGNQLGPVYSFKGIDNDTYYMLTGRLEEPYANFSGAGNTLNCAHRYVRKMILDSLRYWVEEMHVDGFRFDLASVFVRKPDGSIDLEDPGLFGDIIADPRLARTRLIAEPWDAAGAYQLGRKLPGITWFQWNDRFRDDVRRFVRGDPGMVPALMYRLYGSDDLFPDDRMHAYHAYQSVNYVDSHDGFTLYDLVSYNEKRNWANGHGNADGPRESHSWNCGWEGDQDAPLEVLRLRKRQVKNFCCLLFLSNGTPMFRAGDEFLQTQSGNNNPYNQDNPTSWLDWSRLQAHRDIFRFFQCMIRFRKAHPSLGRSRFWREDIRWYGVGPNVDLSQDSRSLAFCLFPGASETDVDIYVMINAYSKDLTFQVQETNGRPWRRLIDTSLESPDDFCEPGAEARLDGLSYVVAARSTVVLIRAN